MRPTVIKIAAWGDRYISSLQENIMPCLMAPGNLEALCARSPTELILCLDREIDFHPDIPNLTVRFKYLDSLPRPHELVAHRKVLAQTDADSVRFALARGADWLSFQADTLVSDEFLPRIKELLLFHLAVAGSPVRMDINALRKAVGDRRRFDAVKLRKLSMECLHSVTMDYFVRDPPTMIPADPHQMLFKTPEGFAARTWQFCPFGISYEGLQPREWESDTLIESITDDTTIDCYFIQTLPAKHVRFHDPATDDFYLSSLDETSGIPNFGTFPMTSSSIVQSIHRFSRDYGDIINYGIALRQRFVYPTDINVPDSLGEEETLAAIRRELVS